MGETVWRETYFIWTGYKCCLGKMRTLYLENSLLKWTTPCTSSLSSDPPSYSKYFNVPFLPATLTYLYHFSICPAWTLCLHGSFTPLPHFLFSWYLLCPQCFCLHVTVVTVPCQFISSLLSASLPPLCLCFSRVYLDHLPASSLPVTVFLCTVLLPHHYKALLWLWPYH